MTEYGRRFNATSDEMRSRVCEAIEFFKELGKSANNSYSD